jgi:dephospho-CoA kinase
MKLNPIKEKLTPQQRLYQIKVPIIGLTGGIGTGKSTVAKMLLDRGHPLICADELVKEVYLHSNTIEFIHQICPDVIIQKDKINFSKLRKLAFSAPNLLSQIEEFIYQRLPQAFETKYEELSQPSYLIYDVPLLFEKKLTDKVDQTVVVYCPREIQVERVVRRDDSDKQTIENILEKQISIDKKKEASDWVIDNSQDFDHLKDEVAKFEKEFFMTKI